MHTGSVSKELRKRERELARMVVRQVALARKVGRECRVS